MKKKRVLLVDSMLNIRARLSEQLSDDYNIVQADNGKEGVDIFRTEKEPFDIILTGYQMPKMGGIKLAKEIRRVNKDIPIILMSITLPDELGQKLIEKDFGITAFYDRQEAVENLRSLIEKLLEK